MSLHPLFHFVKDNLFVKDPYFNPRIRKIVANQEPASLEVVEEEKEKLAWLVEEMKDRNYDKNNRNREILF